MRKLLSITLIVPFLFALTTLVKAQTEKEAQSLLKNKNYTEAVKLYYQLGTSAWEAEQTEKSITLFEKGIEVSENNDLNDQAQQGWYSLGLVQFNSKNYNDAGKSFEESLEFAQKLNKKEEAANSQIFIGKSLFHRGRNRRSIRFLEDALSSALKINNVELQKECYLFLSKNYKELGDDEKVAEYEHSYSLISTDLERKSELSNMEDKISSVTEELATKGQALEQVSDSLKEVQKITEEQRLSIDLLNAEKELADVTLQAQKAELKNNRLVRNSLIVGFILLGILAGVIYKGYKDKMKANEEIHKKQADIESSINYGLRIQQAMLPSKEKFEELLPESFVLFKPRDVVSGDFYWVKELYSEKIAVAAVDCTGHGVPGAFMSMIGSNALNSIVSGYVDEPDKILHELHGRVQTSLKQEETGNKDGMDMALCVIDTDRDKLYFSGAKNHLIYIKEGEVFQIRGDKHPIGGVGKVKASYTQHAVDLEGDMYFYLYSDGFVDQFGGPDNMKFMSKRFKRLLEENHEQPLSVQKEKLEEAFYSWKGNYKQTDDVLVIGFKISV